MKQGKLATPSYNSSYYGLNSIYKNCIDDWNEFSGYFNKSHKYKNKHVTEIPTHQLHNTPRNQLKQLIIYYVLDSYKS